MVTSALGKIVHNQICIINTNTVNIDHMDPAGSAPILPTVSVILPALDEELTIGNCITKIQTVFQEHSIQGEILVVDASTDRTAGIAQQLGATVIHTEKKDRGMHISPHLNGHRGSILS